MKTLIIAIVLWAGAILAQDEPTPVGASDIVKMWAPTYPGLKFMGTMPDTNRWLFMFAKPELNGVPAMVLAIVVPQNCSPKQFESYVVTAMWAQQMTYEDLQKKTLIKRT
jgi:hypothetical protein